MPPFCGASGTLCWVKCIPMGLFTLHSGKHQRKQSQTQMQALSVNGP